MFDSINKFVFKHRTRLAIGLVVAISTTVAYVIYNQNNTSNNQSISLTSNNSNKRGFNINEKTVIIIQSRKQFDNAIKQFLVTLKMKLNEALDITHAIRQIKELRLQIKKDMIDINETDSIQEDVLWEDIKINAFTQLLVTVYLVSALCSVLKLQVYLLARINHLKNLEVSYDNEDSVFQSLIEGTYRHIFGAGLRTLVSLVRQRVTIEMKDWKVKNKLSLEYGEFLQLINQIRKTIESDLSYIIKIVIIPPEADASSLPVFAQTSTMPSQTAQNSFFDTNEILAQIWDISESSMFSASYAEVIDTSFRIMFEKLRQNIFQPETSNIFNDQQNHEKQTSYPLMRKPPLASILPQLKSVSMTFFNIDSKSINYAKDIVDGPVMNALCLSIFDSLN